MNPINMIKMMMGKKMNPQQMLTNMIGKNSNPIINNLMEMTKSGNSRGVEDFARNLFKEKGMDFDKEFSDFMKQIG